MRREFKEILYNEMAKNENIWLITPDLGFGFLNKIIEDFPNRTVKCKATEQLALGIAAGLWYSNNNIIPIVSSISSFLIYRPAEWIRNFMGNENVPIKLLGNGRGEDYSTTNGFTHYCGDDLKFIGQFPNIKSYVPQDIKFLESDMNKWLYNKSPSYLNLKR